MNKRHLLSRRLFASAVFLSVALIAFSVWGLVSNRETKPRHVTRVPREQLCDHLRGLLREIQPDYTYGDCESASHGTSLVASNGDIAGTFAVAHPYALSLFNWTLDSLVAMKKPIEMGEQWSDQQLEETLRARLERVCPPGYEWSREEFEVITLENGVRYGQFQAIGTLRDLGFLDRSTSIRGRILGDGRTMHLDVPSGPCPTSDLAPLLTEEQARDRLPSHFPPKDEQWTLVLGWFENDAGELRPGYMYAPGDVEVARGAYYCNTSIVDAVSGEVLSYQPTRQWPFLANRRRLYPDEPKAP